MAGAVALVGPVGERLRDPGDADGAEERGGADHDGLDPTGREVQLAQAVGQHQVEHAEHELVPEVDVQGQGRQRLEPLVREPAVGGIVAGSDRRRGHEQEHGDQVREEPEAILDVAVLPEPGSVAPLLGDAGQHDHGDQHQRIGGPGVLADPAQRRRRRDPRPNAHRVAGDDHTEAEELHVAQRKRRGCGHVGGIDQRPQQRPEEDHAPAQHDVGTEPVGRLADAALVRPPGGGEGHDRDEEVEDDLVAEVPGRRHALEAAELVAEDLQEEVQPHVGPGVVGPNLGEHDQVGGEGEGEERVDPQEPAYPERDGSRPGHPSHVGLDERLVEHERRDGEEERHEDAQHVQGPGERDDPRGQEGVADHGEAGTDGPESVDGFAPDGPDLRVGVLARPAHGPMLGRPTDRGARRRGGDGAVHAHRTGGFECGVTGFSIVHHVGCRRLAVGVVVVAFTHVVDVDGRLLVRPPHARRETVDQAVGATAELAGLFALGLVGRRLGTVPTMATTPAIDGIAELGGRKLHEDERGDGQADGDEQRWHPESGGAGEREAQEPWAVPLGGVPDERDVPEVDAVGERGDDLERRRGHEPHHERLAGAEGHRDEQQEGHAHLEREVDVADVVVRVEPAPLGRGLRRGRRGVSIECQSGTHEHQEHVPEQAEPPVVGEELDGAIPAPAQRLAGLQDGEQHADRKAHDREGQFAAEHQAQAEDEGDERSHSQYLRVERIALRVEPAVGLLHAGREDGDHHVERQLDGQRPHGDAERPGQELHRVRERQEEDGLDPVGRRLQVAGAVPDDGGGEHRPVEREDPQHPTQDVHPEVGAAIGGLLDPGGEGRPSEGPVDQEARDREEHDQRRVRGGAVVRHQVLRRPELRTHVGRDHAERGQHPQAVDGGDVPAPVGVDGPGHLGRVQLHGSPAVDRRRTGAGAPRNKAESTIAPPVWQPGAHAATAGHATAWAAAIPMAVAARATAAPWRSPG